ncbi:hypothetical protein DFQ01_11194 [Paenibacillus cellulosilyticus]|uniref:Uncharacterized protein n=1 Tax=Paenibacillus cellulosilyticus TaxID=375489 RepID=A0A2V2YTB0_9BACL|nr:hypothetical protein [Paenibacillus cellulosilyticus]PWW00947.1 hypothetical protein DFQ01_11194 [Paenibacillus cellulosilyticus]QKS47595.1 hypothetical protein HUB94_24805 [Paenibacillus cellulosilyticus]
MNSELSKINGYLEALSNLSTFLGNCYGHQYKLVELNVNITEAVQEFNKNSDLSNHKYVEILGLKELNSWEDSLFAVCTHWFFSMFKMRDIDLGEIYYTDGQVVSMEDDKEHNRVSNQLITMLNTLFIGAKPKVYQLITNPSKGEDEFEWEQIYFDVGAKVFVLDFYQWG